jgi:hypothetical protein
MNLAGLFGALVPVFFVLALGYVAGKRNDFDADQASGLSKLALNPPAAPCSGLHRRCGAMGFHSRSERRV